MWLTITLILVAMVALVALELWFFWRLGERDDARRSRARLRPRVSKTGDGRGDSSAPERTSRPARRAA
jgi:hypothetical protein